ncbi:MAG: hypothetical protein C0582_03900 [Alphaproteobacteria bacterium]|nr:MAG: hypothetical protein C0582_03900 [Alphaproteobacteria bacterium]
MVQMLKCVGMVVLFLAPVVGHGSCNTVSSPCTDPGGVKGMCKQPWKGETNCVTDCSEVHIDHDCYDVYGDMGKCTEGEKGSFCVTAP